MAFFLRQTRWSELLWLLLTNQLLSDEAPRGPQPVNPFYFRSLDTQFNLCGGQSSQTGRGNVWDLCERMNMICGLFLSLLLLLLFISAPPPPTGNYAAVYLGLPPLLSPA